MSQLISIPVILALYFLQISVSSKFMLLGGFADLLLVWLAAWVVLTKSRQNWLWFVLVVLITCYVSAIPWYATIGSYLLIYLVGIAIKNRLWQSPLLSFFLVLIIGSLVNYGAAYIGLRLTGSAIQLTDAVRTIILPSLILNLVIALPVYLLARDMTLWLYPQEETS